MLKQMENSNSNFFSQSNPYFLREKKKELENELIRETRRKNDLEMRRQQSNLEPPINENETNANVNKAQWVAKVMKKFPEVLELRERLRPVTKVLSYSRLLNNSKTESREGFTKDVIISLILQHFDSEGKKEIQQFIEEKTAVEYIKDNEKESKLLHLLRLAIRDVEHLWDYEFNQDRQSGISPKEQDDIVGESADRRGLDFTLDVNDIPIWDEPENNPKNIRLDEDQKIEGANINKIIEYLVTHPEDTEFQKDFFLTYESFMKSEHLLMKFIQRFHYPKKKEEENGEEYEKKKKEEEERVMNIIYQWAVECKKTFNEGVVSHLLNFIKPTTYSHKFEQLFESKTEKEKLKRRQQSCPPPKVNKVIFSYKFTLADLDEEEFSRQITLLFWDYYRSIQPPELIRMRSNSSLEMMEDEKRSNTPNITAMMNKLKEFEFYIMDQITSKGQKNKNKSFSRFTKIGDFLRKNNNFVCLYAVMNVLNSQKVQSTLNEVTKNFQQILDDFSELFQNYSKVIEKIKSENVPCIPHIQFYIDQIIKVDNENPDEIDGLINFSKKRKIAKIIDNFQFFQKYAFSFLSVYQVQNLFLSGHLMEQIPVEDLKSDEKNTN
ncbi:ras guanine nucleotide exchange factor h [Anaeramoeba ignava]|uniref:Ras guanine nucleotide exchange factor h n=1 Tax=Anaeramoeba ignava TaxID=1746090 RepID=A0A9Q0LXH8_ANAIG|nr:ras guanine nucleotide exchange factor h [Anaeramoeba ignava]